MLAFRTASSYVARLSMCFRGGWSKPRFFEFQPLALLGSLGFALLSEAAVVGLARRRAAHTLPGISLVSLLDLLRAFSGSVGDPLGCLDVRRDPVVDLPQ